MLYSYIKLADDTQIAYSELRADGTLVVAIERPVDMGFDSARCVLPSYRWSDVHGFTNEEISSLEALLRDNAPLIFELAERRSAEKSAA